MGEWDARLYDAPEGNMLEYHRGFLAEDREMSVPLRQLADAASGAARRGEVTLLQIRNGDFDFSYLAQKR
jgi:hypothetical protein